MLGDLAIKTIKRIEYITCFRKGIEKYWKGKFEVFGYKVSLTTDINVKYSKRKTLQRYNPSNRIVVMSYNSLGVSCVVMSLFGWRKDRPGSMHLYKGDSRSDGYYSVDDFERVCAHEFGHILGINDLYNASNKIRKKYSYKGNYSMMGSQWEAKSVNNYDVIKALMAYKNNREQGWV